MPATITINADQRSGLYELVRNHLGGIRDVEIALEHQGDFATAERLGREFAEDFRLLDDIGWHPGDERQVFALTIPRLDLTKLLNRLHDEAERLLTESPTERRSREEDEATNKQFERGLDACEEVLLTLERHGGDAA
jgi:hypothetical protein